MASKFQSVHSQLEQSRRGSCREGMRSCCWCQTIGKGTRRGTAYDTCDTVYVAAGRMSRVAPSNRCSTPRRPRSACQRYASTAADHLEPNRSTHNQQNASNRN